MGSRPHPPVHIPLALPEAGCWEVDEGRIDSVDFFRSVGECFPEVTTVFVEGTTIEANVVEALQRHAQEGKYLPETQTIWPTTQRFRCGFSAAFCSEFGALAANHAEPELFDHLFLYANEEPLMEWPDAFANCMWISSAVSRDRVAAFAQRFGLSFRHVRVG